MVRTEGGQWINQDTVRTARETAGHSTDTPVWTNPVGFERDVFTFARVIFNSRPERPTWLGWLNDYPDCDLNLSYRLQQMTSLRVDPDGRVLKLTDPDLSDFPLLYMDKPGLIDLPPEDETALRSYLRAGGALLADGFWGTEEWRSFEQQLKRVLPDQTWEELPPDHPLFRSVFRLNPAGNRLQIPPIQFWSRGLDPSKEDGRQEDFYGPGSKEMKVRVWKDARQRIMVIAMHNSDNGDGWEREGENETYFHTFSEKRAYPLAINVIFYLMTH
ncbi:MAG: DUF4159 domain-containing protein [Opitutaceae bacterium]